MARLSTGRPLNRLQTTPSVHCSTSSGCSRPWRTFPVVVRFRRQRPLDGARGRPFPIGRTIASPGRILGSLRLERIGRGAFGEVYCAWDTRLDREVALKLLSASSSIADRRGTSIIEEGRLLARVRHPNVVTIYGADRIENRVGLWMEFVKGRTLQQSLELAEALELTLTPADGPASVRKPATRRRSGTTCSAATTWNSSPSSGFRRRASSAKP